MHRILFQYGPITMSRLKAVPYASLCIQCQRDKERKNKR